MDISKLTVQIMAPEGTAEPFLVTLRNDSGEIIRAEYTAADEKAVFYVPEGSYWMCVRSGAMTNPGGQCKQITTKTGCPVCCTAVFRGLPEEPSATVTLFVRDAHYPNIIPMTGGITVMAKQDYVISVVNGKASQVSLPIGTYTFVSTTIPGYEGATAPSFTIEKDDTEVLIELTAQGQLTIRVVDDLDNPIEDGSLQLSNADGTTTYGDAVDIAPDGKAVFENVPYDADGDVEFYVKQLASDEYHAPIETPEAVTMTEQDQTEEIENQRIGADREVTVVDANYEGIVPLTGNITVNG